MLCGMLLHQVNTVIWLNYFVYLSGLHFKRRFLIFFLNFYLVFSSLVFSP
jgi:hypothetical protein